MIEAKGNATGGRDITRSLNESYNLENEGYPQPRISSAKGRPKSQKWKDSVENNILGSALLRAEKFYRLWHMPATSYSNPFIIPHKITTLYHAGLLFLAIAGLSLTLNKHALFIISSPIIYTSIVYTGYFTEEHRFVYPVMPLVILLAAHTLYSLSETSCLHLQKKQILSIGLCVVLGCTLIALPLDDSYHALLDGGTGWILYYCGLITGLILLTIASGLLAKHLKATPTSHPIAYFFFTAALISGTVHGLIYRDWHTWKEDIVSTTPPIKKMISLQGADIGETKYAFLQVDMRDADGNLNNIEISLDGIKLSERSPLYPSLFHKIAYRHSVPLQKKEDPNLAMYPGMKSWVIFPLSKGRISPMYLPRKNL
jgi:hypothetical protein